MIALIANVDTALLDVASFVADVIDISARKPWISPESIDFGE